MPSTIQLSTHMAQMIPIFTSRQKIEDQKIEDRRPRSRIRRSKKKDRRLKTKNQDRRWRWRSRIRRPQTKRPKAEDEDRKIEARKTKKSRGQVKANHLCPSTCSNRSTQNTKTRVQKIGTARQDKPSEPINQYWNQHSKWNKPGCESWLVGVYGEKL